MPKTKMPPSAPFRSAVEVRTRQYIDSKVAEEVEKIRDDIAALKGSLSLLKTNTDKTVTEYNARVNAILELIDMPVNRLSRIRKILNEEE